MDKDMDEEPNPNFHTFDENCAGEDKKDEAEIVEDGKE